MVSPELRIERLESPTASEQPSISTSSPASPPASDAGLGSPLRQSVALCNHSISAGSPFQMVQLAFGMWQPVAGQKSVTPDSLHIPVDSQFTDSDYRIQVAASRDCRCHNIKCHAIHAVVRQWSTMIDRVVLRRIGIQSIFCPAQKYAIFLLHIGSTKLGNSSFETQTSVFAPCNLYGM